MPHQMSTLTASTPYSFAVWICASKVLICEASTHSGAMTLAVKAGLFVAVAACAGVAAGTATARTTASAPTRVARIERARLSTGPPTGDGPSRATPGAGGRRDGASGSGEA